MAKRERRGGRQKRQPHGLGEGNGLHICTSTMQIVLLGMEGVVGVGVGGGLFNETRNEYY